jgi:hypothetical protein
MAVIADIIEGSYRERDGEKTDERVFIVTGVFGAASSRKIIAATTSGIPRVGEPHPHDPAMSVVDVEARSAEQENSIFHVRVQYSTPTDGSTAVGEDGLGEVTFELTSQSISEESIYDANGNVMQTRYNDVQRTFREVDPQGTIGSLATESSIQVIETVTPRIQTHRVAVERPTFGLRWTRIERTSGAAAAFVFSGRVNSTTFQGLAPKTIVMRISSSQADSDTWRVSYEGIYNPRSWMTEIRTNIDGRTPEDVDQARSSFGAPVPSAMGGFATFNGVSFRDSYPSIDLNLLGLPPIP